MNKRDDIKTFIVVISVCIICLVIGLLLSFKRNSDKLVFVNEYDDFFANVDYVNRYINYIINKDSVAVYNLLDKRYIEDNNITYDNVLYNTIDYSFGASLNATSMKYVEIKDNFIYYIKGNIYLNTFSGKKILDDNFSILVIIDNDSLSYSLYPVDDSNFEDIINSIWKVNIKNNNYNDIVKSDSVTKEQVCVIYFSDFINNLFDDTLGSYDLLSDEMKKKYVNSGSYEKYIIDNLSLISTTADKCKLDEYEDKRIYTVIDNNDNMYKFTENGIMNYVVDFYLKENE